MRTHIHREGRRMLIITYIILIAINAMVFTYTAHWLFAIILMLSLLIIVFMTYFFRNPMRVIEVDDPKFLIAPAEYFHEERLQVSIFMSPFNVHANWYPIEGKVLVSSHQKGRHKGAWLPKSSTENERSLVVLEHANGTQVAVRQVAGAMARRIVTYAKPGMEVKRNQHMGFIKLGSRVDMYLPLNTEMEVEVGDLVHGNETIMGRLPDHIDEKNE